jgi:hypothetical protein
MILKNIKREHIIKAIEDAREVGIPKDRTSKKFLLEFEGEFYPPKYIISLANEYANGKKLGSSEFSGGKETNDFLTILGFNIVDVSSPKKSFPKPFKKNREVAPSRACHDERCPKCKESVGKLLEKIYGRVEQNYKLEIGAHPDDFKNTPCYDELKKIYESLQNHRGFTTFIKAKTLANCDFFVPNPGFIVEFDESQHFTLPRKVTLERYSEKLGLGFDKERWKVLCGKINTKDNDPPYRDEQRAWYDTLRDFLPSIKGLNPTSRLFAKDFVWCSLNPNDSSDVKRFENALKRYSESWKIEVREEPIASIARVIIAGEWKGNPIEAKQLLEDIYKNWPKARKVKFLITCGGFIQFDWPEFISRNDIGDNKNPNAEAVKKLVEKAEKYAKFVLNEDLCRKLSEVTDYITLGIDSFKEKVSTTQNYISQLHVELVSLIDLRNNKFYWTGKSYPTSNQQNGLIRISDFKTHFFELGNIGKVMILGCHDLTIFNPRSKNAKRWRKTINEEFRQLAKQEDPGIVLQHPHTTDSILTWASAWGGLKSELRNVKIYASAGRYHNPERERSQLSAILEKTKLGDSIDFIIHVKKNEDA